MWPVDHFRNPPGPKTVKNFVPARARPEKFFHSNGRPRAPECFCSPPVPGLFKKFPLPSPNLQIYPSRLSNAWNDYRNLKKNISATLALHKGNANYLRIEYATTTWTCNSVVVDPRISPSVL